MSKYYKKDEIVPEFLKADQRLELATLFEKSNQIILMQGERTGEITGECQYCGTVIIYLVTNGLEVAEEKIAEIKKKWIGIDGLSHMYDKHKPQFEMTARKWRKEVGSKMDLLKRLLAKSL
jgi:hypothetical protein